MLEMLVILDVLENFRQIYELNIGNIRDIWNVRNVRNESKLFCPDGLRWHQVSLQLSILRQTGSRNVCGKPLENELDQVSHNENCLLLGLAC